MKPPRGYESLRRYRVTIPHAIYFLTLCTHDRAPGLNQPSIARAIKQELDTIEADGAFIMRGSVLMPDHLHWLLQTTGKLAVGQLVGRLKSKTRAALSAAGLRWQGNFYEHRLRSDEEIEEVLRYLFLNPYRANLVRPGDTYPYFWLGVVESGWFRPTLDDVRPLPEWLT